MRHRPQHMHRLADGPCKLRFTRQKGRFLISYKNTKKGWTEQKKQYLFCFYQLYLLISQAIFNTHKFNQTVYGITRKSHSCASREERHFSPR